MGVVVPEPIVENHRLENFRVENWRASVESEALRKPSAGISLVGRPVHCAIGEAAKLSWEKGHAEFRDSCLFYLLS